MAENFRQHYLKTYDDLLNEDLMSGYYSYRQSVKNAKSRLRMYANLFNRDMRKKILNKYSYCVICKSNERLSIDHIIPITKGGENKENNIQVLCLKCNILKSNN